MIPDYQSLMRPVLEAAEKEPRKISDVVEEISNNLELTEEDRQQLLPSGKQTTIANRIHWSRSYLKQAGLLRNIKRGWFEITEQGLAVLRDPSIKLNSKYLERFEEFQDLKRAASWSTAAPNNTASQAASHTTSAAQRSTRSPSRRWS
jgi:restriction system protein